MAIITEKSSSGNSVTSNNAALENNGVSLAFGPFFLF